MKIAFSQSIIIAIAMLVGSLPAVHALPTAGPNRPVTVPADFVITPFGYFHPSCVAHLTQGDELRRDDNVVRHANGGSEKLKGCPYAHYRANGDKIMADERGIKEPNISGWLESASVSTTGSYGYLSAEWTVPPPPTANDGQTIYLFPGLEDINDVVTILQPVLGWNSDYASAWGIASWNCCVSGTVYEAPPQPVSSGDTILGYMFDNCATGTKLCASWNIITWDLQNGKFSQLLSTSNFGQIFNWAFGGAVEVYNIAQCHDYPTDGSYTGGNAISFNHILLFNNKLTKLNPAWTISTVSSTSTPQCSYGGTVPKQVVFTY